MGLNMTKTVHLTTAQAIVRFLDNQYVSMDGKETKFVEGFFTIFGHGIAVGLGEALDTMPGKLRVMQGRNEQGMCHTAIAFAKQNQRKKIIACASSVGPGAANMVTACATATVNNIPLLVFPADTFASRQPDPVLQQLEQSASLAVSTNDAFRPVCKYWDRVMRPEMVMTALINAMRVLTDPAETGACCIALPQDVEGEAFDYPEYFFEKRVHRITRPAAVEEEIEDAAQAIAGAKKPLVIVGGGVRYSEEELAEASGVRIGANLYLLNKRDIANRMLEKLPYLQEISRIDRRPPDTLAIEVEEYGAPLAVVQGGSAWLVVGPRGKIVEQLPEEAAADYGVIQGCELLAPSVGGKMALATEYATQQTSLLSLMEALEEEGMLDQVDAIHLDDLSFIAMDYGGRFTVKLSYNADYAYKLKRLSLILEGDAIQENMTGTFDMRGEGGMDVFQQNVR